MVEAYRGLVARMYDVWFPPGAAFRDEPFFRKRIEKNGGSALEIGSGTGRLLLPYLQAGLSVEGLESSPEMNAICRAKAEAAGLRPILHEQRMESFTIDKRFETIYVPLATIQLLPRREQAFDALRRFHAHLAPGGELVVTAVVPWTQLEARGEWQLRRVAELDGQTVVFSEAIVSDRMDQSQVWYLRYDVLEGSQVVRSEMHTTRARWYYRDELALMLERCGFHDVRAVTDLDDRPAHALSASDIIVVGSA